MNAPTPEAQRSRYRPILQALAEALRTASGETEVDRRPVQLDQQSVGRLSRMDAMPQQAMAAAQETRRRARLLTVEAALHRLGNDDFGFCVDCGDFIGVKRLDLDPALVRCVDCSR